MNSRMKKLWGSFAVLTIFGCGITAWLVAQFEKVDEGSPLAGLVNGAPVMLMVFMAGTLLCVAFLVWDAGRRDRIAEGRE